MSTVYTYVPSPRHLYPDHPERPGRFELLSSRLERCGARLLQVRPATIDEVCRVHNVEMIRFVEKACQGGDTLIDLAPTFVTRSSFADALNAAGATLQVVEAVLAGRARNGFAVVRPPGHHAEPDRSMGFCIFNNVAIAARAALSQGVTRVAIIDYDAHHGNGTEAAFQNDDRVAYLSTHQWGIYPGTGWYEGSLSTRRRIVNVPLPAASGDRVYARVADEVIEPFVRGFQPEVILISAGFDAHSKDPLTSLGLSSSGFHSLSRRLVQLAIEYSEGKIVFVLEGGYDPINVADGVEAVFAALMNKGYESRQDASPAREPDVSDRLEAIKAWHGFPG